MTQAKTPCMELLEEAWRLICKASGGVWELQSTDWQRAAAAFRERLNAEMMRNHNETVAKECRKIIDADEVRRRREDMIESINDVAEQLMEECTAQAAEVVALEKQLARQHVCIRATYKVFDAPLLFLTFDKVRNKEWRICITRCRLDMEGVHSDKKVTMTPWAECSLEDRRLTFPYVDNLLAAIHDAAVKLLFGGRGGGGPPDSGGWTPGC